MVLEKSEPPSCPAAQSCHPKWMPEDPIYKIGPASCAPLATQHLAGYQPVKESVLHWPGHWSCSVPKAWFRRVQEAMPKAFSFFVNGKMPSPEQPDLTLKLTLLWEGDWTRWRPRSLPTQVILSFCAGGNHLAGWPPSVLRVRQAMRFFQCDSWAISKTC